MKCPKCATESLASTKIREIAVDRCKTCGGIWFDEQELIPLLNEDPKVLEPLHGGAEQEELDLKRGRCPRDTTTLLRVYSARTRSVVVDACPQCHGIWLDGGEFDELLNTVKDK